MGQTLTNGIYLPDEGERNSYSGLEVNWRALDALILTVNGKAAPNIANTWTATQTFTAGITGDLTGNVTGNVTGDLTGTASRAIADEDGTSIKTGYVNVARNQTVSGQKTWSSNQFFTSPMYPKNTSYEIGNTPVSNVAIPIYFADKNNTHTGCVRNVVLITGRTQSELYARNKFTSGALSPTGTDVSSTLQVEVQSNGDKTLYFDGSIRNNVLPYTTNTYSLGSSSYQWSAVYAQTYYYNGTAWGLDKENVWTNRQTYSTYIYGQMIWLKNTGLDFSVNGNTGLTDTYQHMIHWADKNNVVYSSIQSWTASSENTLVLRSYYRTDANTVRDLSVRFTSTATNKVIYPETNADTELGTSTNKWKTLNGINPGALSLPSATYTGATAIVEIDRTGWVYDGTANSYSPPVDCWLSISNGGTITVWGVNTAFGMKATDNIAIPLRLGETYRVSLTHIPDFCRIYPCAGNV